MSRALGALFATAAAISDIGKIPAGVDMVAAVVAAFSDRPAHNHVSPAHPSVAALIAQDEQSRPSIYCFDTAAVDCATSIVINASDFAGILRYFKLPAEKVLFEVQCNWRDAVYAVYAESIDSDLSRLAIFELSEEGFACPLCVMSLHMDGEGIQVGIDLDLHEQIYGVKADRDLADYYNEITHFFVCLCIFLAIGGAVVSERKPLRRLSTKVERAAGRCCVISYNQVRLALPKTAVERRGVSHFERGPGVRRHEVMGHGRETVRKDGSIVWRYIHAYWRGNARLGVVVKERHITGRAMRRPSPSAQSEIQS